MDWNHANPGLLEILSLPGTATGDGDNASATRRNASPTSRNTNRLHPDHDTGSSP